MIGKILTKEQQRLLFESMSNFLPYNLRVKTKKGFNTVSTLNEYCVNSDHENSLTYESGEKLELLPMLRGLSNESLFNRIVHKGVSIVPMIEICRIAFGDIFWNESGDMMIVESKNKISSIRDEKAVHCMGVEGLEFGISLSDKESPYFYAYGLFSDGEVNELNIIHQKLIWQALKRWNFDVDGLIPLGLAVESSKKLDNLNITKS